MELKLARTPALPLNITSFITSPQDTLSTTYNKTVFSKMQSDGETTSSEMGC